MTDGDERPQPPEGPPEADLDVTPEAAPPPAEEGRIASVRHILGRFRRPATPEDAAPPSDDEPAPPELDLAAPAEPLVEHPVFPPPVSALASDPASVEPPPVSPFSYPDAEEEAPRIEHVTEIGAHLVVLSVLATAVILGFLLVEPSPRWLLLLGAGAVVLGLEGTLRQTWRQPFEAGAEPAPYLFVPALYMLGVPVLLEHNVRGELAILAGLTAGLGFAVLAWAELASVRARSLEYQRARLIVTGATYLAAFSMYSLTYIFDVSLPAALAAVALVSAMLAVETLREGEVDPLETLGFALVTGVILAETRWLLYYLPVDRYLAGLTLLLTFYLVTGLLHSYITRVFSTALAAQYAAIAAAGLALVAAARAAGLA